MEAREQQCLMSGPQHQQPPGGFCLSRSCRRWRASRGCLPSCYPGVLYCISRARLEEFAQGLPIIALYFTCLLMEMPSVSRGASLQAESRVAACRLSPRARALPSTTLHTLCQGSACREGSTSYILRENPHCCHGDS